VAVTERQVAVGIHVQGDPERLRATVAALRANTDRPIELLLLLDGADAATRAVCAAVGARSSSTSAPLGAPASFNRLAASTAAHVIVFLENGALVGPGWLERLLLALDADATNGLAGPSTNRCWNEQGAFADSGGSGTEIARTASIAADRFGDTCRTLEPLHSLSDFCYAVRREVLDAIGGADEAYGPAPCWEMDVNIRAARAGFRAVWVPGAYVHRSPPSVRRQRDEARHFDRGRRRYQDKFCALRLRGERIEYEPHCRGDACEHFAPAALIQIRHGRPAPALPAAVRVAAHGSPLVSCIMPTRGRPEWVRQSIRYFMRQDYPARELLVLDDGDANAADIPDNSAIRYVRVPPMSIGAKRNRACELARGEIIAQWDDDDWYGAGRLTAQLAPILADEADITGLASDVFFDLPQWQFWSCTSALHRRLFLGDVHGGTLVYRRKVWEQLARYPDASLAEDAAFLRQATARAARLRKVPGAGVFIYVRHGANAWSFRCGQHVDPRGWHQIDAPSSLQEDREFYARMSPRPHRAADADPLVSCLMPTADRRGHVPRAIRQFLRQDYPNRELVIVDDGSDRVRDLVPDDPRIRYLALDQRVALGGKRNLACQHARGDFFIHWDDDDWMSEWRVSYQVRSLVAAQADLCGLSTLLFFDPAARQAWRYEYPVGGPAWLAGGTLCYTARHWRANPFPDLRVGEDTQFVSRSRGARMLALQDQRFYAALVHSGNTSRKETSGTRYRPEPFTVVEQLLGVELDGYAPGGAPSISCIMPTNDRRLFVPQAIRCFLRQDHPRKELVIVDDGADRVSDLVPPACGIRYLRLDRRLSLGEKRNVAVRESSGAVIAHWDDDDWYHPSYLSRLSARLQDAHDPRALCGLGSYLVWVFGDGVVRLCRTHGVAGATFVYHRSLWEHRPYRHVERAEDFFFLQDNKPALLRHDDPAIFLVVRHGTHTWQSDNGRDVTRLLRGLPAFGRRLDQIADADAAAFYRNAEQSLAGAGDP
jgi:glycosyltransferase involved in cell wall biosynthesis/GT2 family glycosyltransferase